MKELTKEEKNSILIVLRDRFEKNSKRYAKLKWSFIEKKLNNNLDKLCSLYMMEQTGGEPNLLEYEEVTDKYVFCDFSKESPAERRSLCYDKQALDSRKKFKPEDNAKDVASKMGVTLMNEKEYKKLQMLGDFDTKTSSWLNTSEDIRKLGGAIFGDHRYGKVFIYHNGADSYYAARGFRGILKL